MIGQLIGFFLRLLILTHFLKISSTQFDFSFEKLVRVRFGSSEFSKSRFEFGSVRLHLVRVRFGSSEFSKSRFEFGSDRFEPNRTVLVRFGSVRFRALFSIRMIK
jgi:hypothetical protein